MLELIIVTRYVGYRVNFTCKLKTRKLAIGGWNYKGNSYTVLLSTVPLSEMVRAAVGHLQGPLSQSKPEDHQEPMLICMQ